MSGKPWGLFAIGRLGISLCQQAGNPAGPTGAIAPALAEKAHEAFSLGGFGAPACVLPKAAAGMGQGRALGRCATFDKIFNKIV